MRIIHISNGNLKHYGKRYYDQARKITNGLVRNNHDVFFISDRDIARSSGILPTRKLGVRQANKFVIETCRNYSPEIILLGHADIISSETLQEIKSFLPAVKIAQWNVDPIFRNKNIANIKSKLNVVDATFITTAGKGLKAFSNTNGFVSFFPNIVDKSIEWPEAFNNNTQENDVFWALRATKGSWKGDERIDIPLFLERSSKVKIDYHGMNGKDELFNSKYFDAINNCRMGLNISVSRDLEDCASAEQLYLYSSDRISHYTGSGLLVFSGKGNNLEELFEENKEMVFFTSQEELLDKILYFKGHDKERQEIARNCWQKVHRDFNERIVTRYMVEAIFNPDGCNHNNEYKWPTDKY